MAYIDPITKKVVYGNNGATVVNNAISPNPIADQKVLDQQNFKNIADSKVNGTYASKVNDAITSTSGNSIGQPPIETKPIVDTAQIEKDAYKKGIDEATAKFETNNQSNLDSWTATENQRRDAEAEAIRAKVRAAIAEGTAAQNKIISDAPAQFVDPMNRASFQGARNSQALDERMVAMGLGRSGSNITAQTSNNNQTATNINDLENAKAKVISDAQAAIANLQASGSLQEVQMVQEAAAKSLERLQAEQNLIEGRKNDQALAIFNNSTNALKTNYDIGANEKQLGMQEKTTDSSVRTADASLTGIDPKTGLPTADMQRFTKTFNADEAKTLFNQAFQNKSFDYQKTRDTISDKQYDQKWAQELDNIAYSRSENNPMVKAQIINNAIADIEKSRMLDNNSPENQTRYNQAAVIKQQLEQLMAISPEMKVKEFNAGLDQIYANIRQSDAGLDQIYANIRQSDAAASKSLSGGSGAEKFDTNRNASVDDYNKSMEARFIDKDTGEVNKEGAKGYIYGLMKNNVDGPTVKSIMPLWEISESDMRDYENKQNKQNNSSGGGIINSISNFLTGK